MVNWQLIASSIIAPLLVSFVVCILVLGRVYINQIQPLVDQAEANQASIEAAVKKAMTAMGAKSVEVRQDKALEKMISADLLEQFPEVEMILGLVSPKTAEALQENPEQALRIIERYKDFIPLLSGKTPGQAQIEYDL